jgi:hypothetical protein
MPSNSLRSRTLVRISVRKRAVIAALPRGNASALCQAAPRARNAEMGSAFATSRSASAVKDGLVPRAPTGGRKWHDKGHLPLYPLGLDFPFLSQPGLRISCMLTAPFCLGWRTFFYPRCPVLILSPGRRRAQIAAGPLRARLWHRRGYERSPRKHPRVMAPRHSARIWRLSRGRCSLPPQCLLHPPPDRRPSVCRCLVRKARPPAAAGNEGLW